MIRRSDFRYLRASLAATIVMIVASGLLVAYVADWHKKERRLTEQAEDSHRQLQTRLARAREEEAEIKSKIDQFNALLARGVVGDERRLDWVEQLRNIRSGRRLLDLSYELSPQGLLDPLAAPVSSGGYEFYASPMRLTLPLLHEGDLINLLDDLEATVSAYIRPKRCTVERAVGAGGTPTGNAQLRADCIIDWITVRARLSAG